MLKVHQRGWQGIFVLTMVTFMTIAACGHSGGGGALVPEPEPNPSPSPAVNTPPVAVINGVPQAAVPGTTVVLDALASVDPDGDAIAAYAWSQTGGDAIVMSSADQSELSFVVPNATTLIVIELVVTDSRGAASTAGRAEIPVTAMAGVLDMDAVVVSASMGSDEASATGAPSSPVRTITRGLAIAAQVGVGTIYVMEGTYVEEVVPASGIRLLGNVAAVTADGTPIFSPAFSGSTVIQAPPQATQAIRIQQVTDVQVSGFRIAGAAVAPTSIGVLIEHSRDVVIEGNLITTIGAAGALCRDVRVWKGDGVTVANNRFTSSGVCKEAVGVDVEETTAISLHADGQGNAYAFAAAGAEQHLKPVRIAMSDGAIVVGQEIGLDRTAVAATTAVIGITVSDTTNATVEDNAVVVVGAKQSAGLLVRCDATQMAGTIAVNAIDLSGAAEKQHGIVLICSQQGSAIAIEANRIGILPPEGGATAARGIEVQAMQRSIALSLTNNIVVLRTARNGDATEKRAVILSLLGKDSQVSLKHNTFLVTGNSGNLVTLSSDRPDVLFSAINNIFFVYGAVAGNAVFALPAACETGAQPAYCAKTLEANFINAAINATPLPLMVLAGTPPAFVALATANECDADPALPRCVSGGVVRTANIFEPLLFPSSFNLATGELAPGKQVGVIDHGHDAGVTVDIDGEVRSQPPDIGATEY